MSICIALDIEGVLLPELWSVIADHTGQAGFRRTTTEEADIDILKTERLAAARTIGLTRSEIEASLRDVMPLPGAIDFLRETRSSWPTILVSDSFNELLEFVSHKLLLPAVFCHSLQFDPMGRLIGYRLRQHNQKPKVVAALKSIGFKVMAAGDSLNDIAMLHDADAGAFINARASIRAAHPTLPSFGEFSSLLAFFRNSAESLNS
jgi:phosphoserine/homoserine phosphotransferase